MGEFVDFFNILSYNIYVERQQVNKGDEKSRTAILLFSHF